MEQLVLVPSTDPYPLQVPLPRPPQRIAIIRALQLGDLLVAVPALRAIRTQFPNTEITLIGLAWAASFAQRFRPYIDRFVEFVGYSGIQELPVNSERTARFLKEQRDYGYDLVIQMHGSGRTSNSFALALEGAVTTGYYEETLPQGFTFGVVYPHDQHEIWRNLGLAALLGCTHLDPGLEFPLFQEDYAEAASLLERVAGKKRVCIGIHAGARPPARRWPALYFGQLADMLIQRYNAVVLLTGSPGEESTIQAIENAMQQKASNVVGQTSLGGLAALISRLDLFISNDTGPAHLAVAVNTPSITLFGPADYQRWAPLDQTLHPVVRHPVACSPCGYWECPIDHRCLRWVTPDAVYKKAQELL